jgi:hypothetical protein
MVRQLVSNAAVSLLAVGAVSLARLFLPAEDGSALEETARAAVLGPPEAEEHGPVVATPAPAAPEIGDSAVLPASHNSRFQPEINQQLLQKRGKYRRIESDNGSAAEPEDPAEIAVAPVVNIMAPADALLGDQIYLRAVVTGDARFFRWRVSPAADGLIVMEGGRSAVFSNRNPGLYRFICAVSGPGGVELDEAEIEIVDPAEAASQAPDPPAAANPVPTAAAAAASAAVPQMSAASQQAAYDQQVASWVGLVQSNARIAEAKIVSGAFRTIAEALQARVLPSSRDPVDAVFEQANVALGASRGSWRVFFEEFAKATNDQRYSSPRDPALLLATASALSRLR